MYELIVETFEGSKLVVTHIFHGDTADEAEDMYKAHLEADKFLCKCKEDKKYKDFKCRNKVKGIFKDGKKIR